MTFKNIFFKKYAVKCHENDFFLVGIVKERIFRVGSETGDVTFLLVKEDPDPNLNPKLGRKWDPDPKKKFRIHNTAVHYSISAVTETFIETNLHAVLSSRFKEKFVVFLHGN
jgi:hypothetical protein